MTAWKELFYCALFFTSSSACLFTSNGEVDRLSLKSAFRLSPPPYTFCRQRNYIVKWINLAMKIVWGNSDIVTALNKMNYKLSFIFGPLTSKVWPTLMKIKLCAFLSWDPVYLCHKRYCMGDGTLHESWTTDTVIFFPFTSVTYLSVLKVKVQFKL